MKKSNENTTYELVIMNKTLVEKTEKLTWMERKVNKWIKMFEESEQDGASRHNSLIEKINEVDTSQRKTIKGLERQLTKIEEKGSKNGGKAGKGGKGDDKEKKGGGPSQRLKGKQTGVGKNS